MSHLSHIIEALQGATADLREDNDRADAKVVKRKPCTCGAYNFPHRRANYCVDVPETVYYVDNVNEKAMLEAGHKWSDF
jgi:hypothetical protein